MLSLKTSSKWRRIVITLLLSVFVCLQSMATIGTPAIPDENLSAEYAEDKQLAENLFLSPQIAIHSGNKTTGDTQKQSGIPATYIPWVVMLGVYLLIKRKRSGSRSANF